MVKITIASFQCIIEWRWVTKLQSLQMSCTSVHSLLESHWGWDSFNLSQSWLLAVYTVCTL